MGRTSRTALEAAARDLTELRAMGFVTGDAGKEKILSVSFSLPPFPLIDLVVLFGRCLIFFPCGGPSLTIVAAPCGDQPFSHDATADASGNREHLGE
jgi:hypothetical protein